MSAKDIQLKPISATIANDFVKKNHYSGKVVPNSQVHIGVYYFGKLEGVMQYGPCLKKKQMLGLVKDTTWDGFIELNRMAFSDALPKNSESRAIGISLKILKKHLPQLQWVISFADATQCGDGTIYRASNFLLTGIKSNDTLRVNPATGQVMQSMTAYHLNLMDQFKNWDKVEGFQLRYLYFYDKKDVAKLTVPVLPFSEIAKRGATMYKGVSGGSISSNVSGFLSEEGGANPTPLLQTSIKGSQI
jgi:hypothetical protein